MLDPIPHLEFFEDLHRYRYEGRWLPFSVSKIASPASPEAAKRFAETRHLWEPRGNTVHAYCEAMLTGQEKKAGDYAEWTDPPRGVLAAPGQRADRGGVPAVRCTQGDRRQL